jgi:hypothetical protein
MNGKYYFHIARSVNQGNSKIHSNTENKSLIYLARLRARKPRIRGFIPGRGKDLTLL